MEASILMGIQGAAAILDENGNILTANEQWESEDLCSNWFSIKPNDSNYLAHCKRAVGQGNDYALRLIFGLREVLEGKKKVFELTVSSQQSCKKWFKVTVSPLIQDEETCALVVFIDVTRQMKTIQSLRESEEKYSQHFKHSVSGIMFATSDGKILDANPAACRILGYSREELMEGGLGLIVDEDDPVHLEMVRIREEKSFFEGEKEYIHKEGHTIPVDIVSVKYRSEDGSMQIINTFRDKSKEKEATNRLEEERRFTEAALNSIPGIFFVMNSDREFIRLNESMVTDLGYSERELLEMNTLQIFSPDEHEEIEAILNHSFDTGSGQIVTTVLNKQSGPRIYHIQLKKFERLDEPFLVGAGVDITEFIESEHERKKNYNLLTQLFENSPLAKVMLTPANKVQRVNQGFIDLFGYTEKELIGKNIDELITSQELMEETNRVSSDARNGIADQRETLRMKKDGSEIPVLVTTVPVTNNETIIAFFDIYVDLSAQKQLETRLQKSLHQKDVLLQEVHHRVKNNLAIIAGLLELQIMTETNEIAKKQLTQAHDRVFSIAKIHETLYNQKDVTKIRFDDYLKLIFEAMPDRVQSARYNIADNFAEEPLVLNINQAVPLGLLINEMINLCSFEKNVDNPIELSYTSIDNKVTVTISSSGLQIKNFRNNSKKCAFQKMLIKTFLEQIDADIKIVENSTNKACIEFRKSDSIKGSSNALMDESEILKTLYTDE